MRRSGLQYQLVTRSGCYLPVTSIPGRPHQKPPGSNASSAPTVTINISNTKYPGQARRPSPTHPVHIASHDIQITPSFAARAPSPSHWLSAPHFQQYSTPTTHPSLSSLLGTALTLPPANITCSTSPTAARCGVPCPLLDHIGNVRRVVRAGGMGEVPDAVGVHTRGMLSVGEKAAGVRAFGEPTTEESEACQMRRAG